MQPAQGTQPTTKSSSTRTSEHNYYVVLFKDDPEPNFYTVPSIWLELDSYCYWPPNTLFDDKKRFVASRDKKVPDLDTWELCAVDIKAGCSTMVKALDKMKILIKNEVQLNSTTTAASDVDDDLSKKRRLRKRRNYRLAGTNDCTDESEQEGHCSPIVQLIAKTKPSWDEVNGHATPPAANDLPSPTAKRLGNPFVASSQKHTKKAPSNKPYYASHSHSKQPPRFNTLDCIETNEQASSLPACSSPSTFPKHSHAPLEDKRSQPKQQHLYPVPVPKRNEDFQKCLNCNNKTNTDKRMFSMLEKILQQVGQNTVVLHQMQSNAPIQPLMEATPTDAELGFPIKTIQELMGVNELWKDKSELSKVVNHLGYFGGKDVTVVTRRILTNMFSDSLAKTFNWTGRDKRSIQDFKQVLLAVTLSVRRNGTAQEATRDTIESVIKPWFRHASERFSGRRRQNQRLGPLNIPVDETLPAPRVSNNIREKNNMVQQDPSNDQNEEDYCQSSSSLSLCDEDENLE